MLSISEHARRGFARESVAVLLCATAAFLLLCLISYDYRDPSFNVATNRPNVSNMGGLVGSHIADSLIQLLGFASVMVPIGLLVIALRLFRPKLHPLRWTEAVCTVLLTAGAAALAERYGTIQLGSSGFHPGGALGDFLHALLSTLLGAGEVLFGLTLAVLCILHLFQVPFPRAAKVVYSWAGLLLGVLVAAWTWLRDARLRSQEVVQADDHEDYLGPYVAVCEADTEFRGPADRGMAPFEDEEIVLAATAGTWWGQDMAIPVSRGIGSDEGSQSLVKEPEESNSAPEYIDQEPEDRANVSASPDHLATQDEKSRAVSSARVSQQALEEAIEEYAREEQGAAVADVRPKGRKKGSSSKGGQTKSVTVARRADEEIVRAEHRGDQAFAGDDYVFPSLDLLDSPPPASRCVDEKSLERNASTLEQKLGDLGIKGEVVAIHPGPVITMYELNLAPGVPLRKVLNTADDLAMALKSGSTRVVAPIHGKDTVGIEVPNLNREIVHFREIIESPVFEELDSPLKMAIGKGIDGKPFATSLTRMPHLMIAGATGTGKSVGLNSLICSWLMYCHPDDLKLLMVDPKKLELSYYQDIPHLLHPVVTDAEKVPKVLSWAIREMERRYDLLSKAGAKNVESYNRKILSSELITDSQETPPEKLPYIVIIVDELAELMMVAAKDIEISIARLAQMARASGIHLILATQRPSVDVITGVIKANFPARISYQVSAKPDSRTILDTTGAEHLLGMGDMLFLPPGVSKLIRLHGAYVSENEIRRIVDFIKAQRAPVYLQEIAKHVSEPDPSTSGGDFLDDPKYDEAVELVSRLGHASISLIQRHMRIGYNRAARIIEAMEGEGLVGPSDGTSRPREVLVRALDAGLDRGRESFV